MPKLRFNGQEIITGDDERLTNPREPLSHGNGKHDKNYIEASEAPVQSVAGKIGAVTLNKADVGLSNVDDLSAASIRSGTTKADVGLSNVDNLSAASIRSGTTKTDVGLSNVDNVKQMPMAGGTFTGAALAQNNTNYTTAQLRNVIMSTSDPSGGNNGDIWIKYK